MKPGFDARARAISTRRRSPPDSAIAGVWRRWVTENSREQVVQHGFPGFPVRFDHFQRGADIVLDVHAAENRRLLRQIADPEARTPVHGQVGYVLTVEQDRPGVGPDQPVMR